MLRKLVFIIDDEYDIREFLKFNLKKEGYEVHTFDNPISAMSQLKTALPDIVVTDWLMPDMDGLEVCRAIKMDAVTTHIPVIMITCKGDEIDIVTALEIGADDYLVKPFGTKELAVRIKKILQKNGILSQKIQPVPEQPLAKDPTDTQHKGLIINKETYSVYLDNQKIKLTYAEFKLLELLAERPGKVFSRNQIIEHDYGQDYYVTERSVDVKIVGLRKKLGKYENMIETIRSVGYKFNESALYPEIS